MSSFQQEVGKTREMLEGTNRTLTGTDDVIYFRPPIKIRLKKQIPIRILNHSHQIIK